MALITSAATVASAHQLAGGDLTSVRGALGLTGVVLGSSTSLDQGRRALRAFFPDQMKKVSDRLKRSPIIGPWVRDSRPWWQRWRRRSKPDG
jgi:hypothetical protein